MKKINSVLDIDFSLPVTLISITYILPKGVIVHVIKYTNGRMDVRVTNANYSDGDFHGKSYGNNYERPEWFQEHIAYWVKQSEIV